VNARFVNISNVNDASCDTTPFSQERACREAPRRQEALAGRDYAREGDLVSLTASQRALIYLHKDGDHHGVSCFDVGNAVWPDRVIRGGRGVSVNGGGDYAAQMLLGRLKRAGLVEHAPSEGSSRWRLTADGLAAAYKLRNP
jgi:hypothetical protein